MKTSTIQKPKTQTQSSPEATLKTGAQEVIRQALGAYRAGLLQANAQIAETGRWYDSLRSAAE